MAWVFCAVRRVGGWVYGVVWFGVTFIPCPPDLTINLNN